MPRKLEPRPPLEKHIQAAIHEWLELCGCRVYTIGTVRKRGDHQGTMQTPGLPDLLVFVPGEAWSDTAPEQIWVECKRPGTYQTPEQKLFEHRATTVWPESYYVWRSLAECQAWAEQRELVEKVGIAYQTPYRNFNWGEKS